MKKGGRLDLICCSSIMVFGLIALNAFAQAPNCQMEQMRGPPTTESLVSDGWNPVNVDNEVRVYNRKRPESTVYEVLVSGVIDSPPKVVYETVTDYASYSKFMPYTSESRVLREEANSIWVYEKIHLPIVSNRNFVVKVNRQACFDEGNLYWVDWDQVSGYESLTTGGGVVPTVNNGYWALWTTREGRATVANYYLHLDPGGSLPAFLVNLANGNSLPKVIEAVRKRALDCQTALNFCQ